VRQSVSRRIEARGKFLFSGSGKVLLRGVTYGTFRPDADGNPYPDPRVVEADFAMMAANGVNAVRLYAVPPRWLLDCAQAYGLTAMVGIPWEHHVAFLDERRKMKSVEERVREGVRTCAGHPAVFCYAVGNEIPASIVRWHGRRRVERALRRLCAAARSEDPGALVTYVNYPSTEYLDLPFVDLVCFNVFLEEEEKLEAYLAHLQNVAGDRPLVIAETGLDGRRHGEEAQALALGWQLRTAWAAGVAGSFVFSWTDEWHRGKHDVCDWEFGLTDRRRTPKPSLAAVREAYEEAPFPVGTDWPSVSVVVCTYNGAQTLRECLGALVALEYPDFEVIVVDDGSTDETAAIASEYPVRLIQTENQGLGAARNVGIAAASGELIAFVDDDAWPDPDWLTYLAAEFQRTPHAGIGGPNVPPPGNELVAASVANAPGGPIHVLLTDRQAEHIPGCNMAFRKDCLDAVGGFDSRFRVAGDDVDICWKVNSRGWSLGFSPAAMVWHRRRNSVRTFLRQQFQYGRAEALLEQKWPERYNGTGNLTWSGRVYGGVSAAPFRRRPQIYYGTWGTGPFQSLYQAPSGFLSSLTAMPEWYLVVAALAVYGSLALHWRPLVVALPLLVLSLSVLVVGALAGAGRARFPHSARRGWSLAKLRGVTAVLFLLQPLARLLGRTRGGLTPWRSRGPKGLAVPVAHTRTLWSENWRPPEGFLTELESELRLSGAFVSRSGHFDRCDLRVRGGTLGGARIRLAVEEHGHGRQLVRARVWPRSSRGGALLSAALAALALLAAFDAAWPVAALLGAGSLVLAFQSVAGCARAVASLLQAFDRLSPPAPAELDVALARRVVVVVDQVSLSVDDRPQLRGDPRR
jgi:GT2 family glycosyltransferase